MDKAARYHWGKWELIAMPVINKTVCSLVKWFIMAFAVLADDWFASLLLFVVFGGWDGGMVYFWLFG